MSFEMIVWLFCLAVIAMSIFGVASAKAEKDKIDAMNPYDRINYVYGPSNTSLICPHCQTKGRVHVKKATRVSTSTGKVGGILKTDTRSTTTNVVTQHHCEQCSSTWDI